MGNSASGLARREHLIKHRLWLGALCCPLHPSPSLPGGGVELPVLISRLSFACSRKGPGCPEAVPLPWIVIMTMGDSRHSDTPAAQASHTRSMARACARRMQQRKHVLTSNSQMGKLGLRDGETYPKQLHPYTVGRGHTRRPGGRSRTLLLGSAGTWVECPAWFCHFRTWGFLSGKGGNPADLGSSLGHSLGAVPHP